MARPAMPRKFWTAGEVARLHRLYPKMTAVQVARRLGRTEKAVYQRAKAEGLATQHRTDTGPAFRSELARLNALGWTDPEIAAELGCERHTVAKWRRWAGLPHRRFDDHMRRRVAEKTAEQCRKAGVESLADVRVLAFRRRAVAAGWPADLRPREVQILEALMARGPMTRREIAGAIGLPWHGSRRSLKCRGGRGSYVANLLAVGLVVDLGRLVRGPGRGGSSHLYSAALDCERSATHVG